MSENRAERSWVWPASIFLLFILIALFYSWPLPLHFNEAITGSCGGKVELMCAGDHLQTFYHLGNLEGAIKGEHDWFISPLEFHYNGTYKHPFSQLMPVSILYIPFLVFSKIIAYNMFMLIVFALGGLAMYLWAFELVKNRFAAFAGALFYNIAFYRVVELLDGQPGASIFFLAPLTLYFFERLVKERSLIFSALAGISFMVLTWSADQYSYYLSMMLVAYCLPRLIFFNSVSDLPKRLLAFLPFLLLFGISCTYAMHTTQEGLSTSLFKEGFTLAGLMPNSSYPIDAIVKGHGKGVYLGLLPIMCIVSTFVYALFCVVTGRKTGLSKWNILLLSIGFFISYLLAFGSYMDKYIPLFSFFLDHVPYYKYSRYPAKIMVIVLPAGGALIASFVAILADFGKWRHAMTFAGILILSYHLVDQWPGGAGIALLDRSNAVVNYLKKEKRGNVLNIPLWDGHNAKASIYQYYALESGRPMINGYFPMIDDSYSKDVLDPLYKINFGELGKKEIELLRKMDVNYIVFHKDLHLTSEFGLFGEYTNHNFAYSPYLAKVAATKNSNLYKIEPTTKPEARPLNMSGVEFRFAPEMLSGLDGKRVKDQEAKKGYALFISGEGYMNAGPYADLPRGKYRAIFRVKVTEADDKANEIFFIDATGRTGEVHFGERRISAIDLPDQKGYANYDLTFEIKEASPDIELHLYSLSNSSIYLEDIRLVQVTNHDAMAHLSKKRAGILF